MAFSLNSANFIFTSSLSTAGYPFSLIGWFRAPNVNALTFLMGIIDFPSGTSCDVLFAGNTTKEAVAKTKISGSFGEAYSSSPMIPGKWHHLVGVFASDSDRKIYLDGSNVGVNNDNISIPALNTFYFGNPYSATFVDVAEPAFVQAAVSAEQATALASGGSVLALPNSLDVLAYHDCIRQVNRPGLGPKFIAAGGATVLDHPRTRFATGGRSTVMPNRVRGPWRVEQTLARPFAATQGQPLVAGIASNNSILSGQVVG